MKKIYTLLILIFCFRAQGQFMDTLHEVFKRHGSIDARFESRTGFINNNIANVTGVRLGIAFKRKLRIGGGVSWLKTEVVNRKVAGSDTLFEDGFARRYKFAYLCYYIDFVFYRTKRWQLSVPIQAGTGICWNQYGRGYNFWGKDAKYFLMLYEPGITVQYKVFRWFGLGADVAYRFAYSHARQTGINLNSPTFSFKLLFWFDQLYFDIFPGSEITKKYGPSEW